jgi:PAS domain S-box-containing protein
MLQTRSVLHASSVHEHLVQFYEKDDFLLDEVTDFLGAGLRAGHAGVVIATQHHRDGLARRLGGRLALDADRYVALDAAAALEQFMVGGWPDERLFQEAIGGVLGRAAQNGSRRVCAFGEMVTLLWAEGRHDAALRLEELWNELAAACSLSLLCAYPMGGFDDEEHGRPFLRICEAHSGVRPAESFVEAADADELRRQVARLQQKAAALETEVARRRQADRSLRERERELSDFLENAAEGLHKVGPDGTILWANRAELDMLGYQPDEYVGQHIAKFHADAEVIEAILAGLRRGEALYDQPARLRCKDGSIKHVLIHSNVLVEDGEFVHTRCFTRDVTERVRLEAELQRQLEQLAEIDRRKDEFLAMLGHELRNPLAAIVSAVELMRRSGDSAHLARSRDIVARQSAAMARLVDDLLDISRITRGKINLQTGTVLLDSLVERALETVRPLIEERRQRLTVDLPAVPVSLSGDAARLVQVLANLLHNAAKYTDPGGEISLEASRDGTDLRLRVRDNGRGMTAEVRERLFEPFFQAPGSAEHVRSGLGIGLTLVRSLVELHGGSIEARSDGPGRGSEFEVRLPFDRSPHP